MRPDYSRSSEFAHLVGKATFDPEFAEKLEMDPEAALRHIGIEPTDEVLGALDEVDISAIRDLAIALGDEQGVV
jgi:hypothetical protein